jgi:pimeloyl-ACP methyl ester carboxylesterase
VDRLILSGAAINGFTVSKHFNDRNMHIALPMLVGNLDGVIANAAKDPWLLAPGHDAAREKAIALSKASPQNFRHQMRDPIKSWPSDLPRMPGLTVPTLILVGDHDIPDVQAMAGAAQVLIPGSKRVVVSDSGHLMQLEHPREVADLIDDFVRKGR